MINLNTDIINYISSFIQLGQNGILNLVSKKYKNPELKILLDKIIVDDNLKIWYCKTYKFDLNLIDCNWSSKKGLLNCLIYSMKINKPCNVWTCTWAAYYGNLNCLKYLYNQGIRGNIWTSFKCVEKGNLDCLIFLHKNNCFMNEYTCYKSVDFNQIHCLKFLLDNLNNLNYYNIKKIKTIAINNKRTEIINYILERYKNYF